MLLIYLSAALVQPAATASAQERSPRYLLKQPKFFAAFDMYSRARSALVIAGNRLCAATPIDKPRLIVEYHALDERLRKVATKLKSYHPNVLNLRPTVMYGPAQLLCGDEKAAREAIGALEDVVVAAEYLSKDDLVARSDKRQ
jgi:hypothetical protein